MFCLPTSVIFSRYFLKKNKLYIRATHGKQDFSQIEPGLTCWDVGLKRKLISLNLTSQWIFYWFENNDPNIKNTWSKKSLGNLDLWEPKFTTSSHSPWRSMRSSRVHIKDSFFCRHIGWGSCPMSNWDKMGFWGYQVEVTAIKKPLRK